MASVLAAGCAGSALGRAEASNKPGFLNEPDADIVCPVDASKRIRASTYREIFAGDQVDLGDQDLADFVAPRLLSTVPVEYPKTLLGKFRAGFVSVAFLVEPDGSVSGARVVCSSDRSFEQSAIAAVAAMRYAPGTIAGIRRLSPAIQPFEFAPQ